MTKLTVALRRHVTLHMQTCDITYADMMNSLAVHYIKLLKQIIQVFSAFILYSLCQYFVHRAVFENFHKFM